MSKFVLGIIFYEILPTCDEHVNCFCFSSLSSKTSRWIILPQLYREKFELQNVQRTPKSIAKCVRVIIEHQKLCILAPVDRLCHQFFVETILVSSRTRNAGGCCVAFIGSILFECETFLQSQFVLILGKILIFFAIEKCRSALVNKHRRSLKVSPSQFQLQSHPKPIHKQTK